MFKLKVDFESAKLEKKHIEEQVSHLESQCLNYVNERNEYEGKYKKAIAD